MAVVNFGVCLVLVLYQLSAAYSDEVSSESTDLGFSGELKTISFESLNSSVAVDMLNLLIIRVTILIWHL